MCQESRQRGVQEIMDHLSETDLLLDHFLTCVDQCDDPVHKYKFGKKTRMSKDDQFKIVRTREEVDM